MAIPFLNNITLRGNEIQNVKLHNTGSAPAAAALGTQGQLYFNTTASAGFDGVGKKVYVASDVSNVAGTYAYEALAYEGWVESKFATIPADDTTALDQPLVFVPDAGNGALKVDGTGTNDLTYNPSSQTLKVQNIVVNGTQTVLNETIQVVENNTIAFEGTTEDDHEIKLTAANATGADKTITLPNLSGHVALFEIGATAVITSTPAELNVLDANTVGASVTLADGDSIIIGDASAANLTTKVLLSDIKSYVESASNVVITIGNGSTTSYNLQNTGATAPNKNHGLGADSSNFMIQLVEVSSGETVYADVTRGASGLVTIDFASAPTANNIRVLITNIA